MKNDVELQIQVGRFLVKTLSTAEEFSQAFALRYQVFQVEMIGHEDQAGQDEDEFDRESDHLGIFDLKSETLIATCRLNSSLFSNKFYSSQEFDCESLLTRSGVKLEIGRVCVHRDFRKGILVLLLWRAIADYMQKTSTNLLFGCGSVMTEDVGEAVLLYRYLQETGKIRGSLILPTAKYLDDSFLQTLVLSSGALRPAEVSAAENLLPPLFRSYLEIGCFVPGPPAFDRDFKCIDFLTVLEVENLEARVRQKMMGL